MRKYYIMLLISFVISSSHGFLLYFINTDMEFNIVRIVTLIPVTLLIIGLFNIFRYYNLRYSKLILTVILITYIFGILFDLSILLYIQIINEFINNNQALDIIVSISFYLQYLTIGLAFILIYKKSKNIIFIFAAIYYFSIVFMYTLFGFIPNMLMNIERFQFHKYFMLISPLRSLNYIVKPLYLIFIIYGMVGKLD